MKKDFRKGFSDGIPIGLGYFSVAFGFGILAMSSKISAFSAWLISAKIYILLYFSINCEKAQPFFCFFLYFTA